MKTVANFVVLVPFAKISTTKISIEYGGVTINGCVIILNNGDCLHVYWDHGCWLSFARKAVFVQQHLPKLLLRYGNLDQQQLPLCPFIIVGVASRHTHKLSFPIICKSFHYENSTYNNSGKFFTRERFPLYSIPLRPNCFTTGGIFLSIVYVGLTYIRMDV